MDLRTLRTVAVRAIALAVAGSVVLIIAATILIPRIVGGSTYTILTGSMEPTMPPGTVVVVRPTPANEIKAGDVITYQLKSGEPTVVTHRVVSVGVAGDGELRFITQGDANNVADAVAVKPVQVKGVRWYSVPWIGYPAIVTGASTRQLVVMGSVCLLGAYAVTMIGSDIRDRRRKRATAAATTEPERELVEVSS